MSRNAERPSGQSRIGHADRARAKRERGALSGLIKVRDRRRFKSVPVPTGELNLLVSADAVGTRFPTRVFDVSPGEAVLKDGASNAKIGGDVLVGWLKGARILTLTLEERATCPRSCPLWRGCYGNSMQLARRWRHGPELEERLESDVAAACAGGRPVLIRLHVLGDFYSVDYALLWWRLLSRHANLFLFGFTAHGVETPIGGFIADMREIFGRRAAIRHSGRAMEWGSFTIDFPTERKTLGDAVVCPEQRDAMSGAATGRHCGNCGVCWSSGAPVVFVEH